VALFGGGWLGASDEESRAYLQERLATLSKLMFWSFVVLIAAISLLYWRVPHIEPARQRTIMEVATGGVVLLAMIWRLGLVRRTLSINQLYAIDAFYAVGTGTIFAISAYLARDFRPSAYSCLLYTCFMILLRAITVPSTGARTAVTGALLSLPLTIAAIAIAVQTEQDLPGPAYVGSEIVVCTIVVLFATFGSRTIYGLRRQVSEAMQLGQYTLDRKIGEGGMGAVYRARHALLRRPTAIKILRPERAGGAATLDRFEREVQHMSRLTHPNTVAVYDYGRNHDGVFYYAMEYLDGIDLERLVARFGPQPADRVAAILVQVCGALQEAHRVGIVHRDIKPANIILCDRGGVPDVAKVVDFGLVKEITPADADAGSSAQIILGTPAYIAPEAVTEPKSVGPAVDLYALGGVGYFLVTGKRVFEGKTPIEVCVQHVTAPPRPPSQVTASHVPEALERAIMSCLAKAPDARPSASELAKALRALPAGDWTDDQAVAWWEEFHSHADASPSADIDTITITVDLGGRT
jgi:hypothetical protein